MTLPAADFARFVELNAGLDAVVADPARRRALRAVLRGAGELLRLGPRGALEALPRRIGEHMGAHGWAWNGFYAPLPGDGDVRELHLSWAWGPPVCSPLVRSGGPLSSGMCFDGWAMNQTLAAYDAKAWPGYVSCDAASGLGTVAGIVAPVRGPDGSPVAVWDLDAVRPIEPGDVRAMDVLFATLARCLELRREDFARPAGPS